MIRRFILRWLVNFLGLWTAVSLLQGITYQNKVGVLIIAALVFSIVNAFVRPLVVLLSLPAIVLSLGLFTFVVNTLMLYLVQFFYPKFHIASFWSGLVAVIIIWIVNYLLNDLLEPRREPKVSL
jgi:putative membrane protein